MNQDYNSGDSLLGIIIGYNDSVKSTPLTTYYDLDLDSNTSSVYNYLIATRMLKKAKEILQETYFADFINDLEKVVIILQLSGDKVTDNVIDELSMALGRALKNQATNEIITEVLEIVKNSGVKIDRN